MAPQIDTRRILALITIARAFSGSAGGVDIGMAQPFEMGDHRDAALALHPIDQRRPAARHDDVDGAGQLEHDPDRGAVAHRHQLDRRSGQVRLAQTFGEGADQGLRRMEALRSAAQDRGVAGFERQPAGIGGDVGPTLVDDADDAQGHGDAFDVEPVRPRPAGERAADRVGQRGDVLEPLGDRLDPLAVERQPVLERRRQALGPGLGAVARIGGEDRIAAVAHRLRRGAQGARLCRRRRQRQRGRGRAGAAADRRHFGGKIRVRRHLGSVTTRSSR